VAIQFNPTQQNPGLPRSARNDKNTIIQRFPKGAQTRIMYEPRHKPPIPVGRFVLRMLAHAGLALALIGISLFAGVIGYEHY